MLKNINKKIKNFIFINIGVMGLALSFSFFLSPYELVTGGIGGIAINVINILSKFGVVITESIHNFKAYEIGRRSNFIKFFFKHVRAYLCSGGARDQRRAQKPLRRY